MSRNVSRRDVNMKKENFVWTAQQQHLLNLAKAGNEQACGRLFESMKNMLESVHRYSQDGHFPSKFGYDYNFKGRTFEEASGEIYLAFRNAVSRFDSSLKVPFGAYVVNEIRLRAKDWTRDRQNDRLVLVGQSLSDDSYQVLSQEDYEEAVNNFYEGKSQSKGDSETHPVESCEIMDLVSKISGSLTENGEQRLVDFVTSFLEFAGEKGTMDSVAECMGVSRAMAYVYLDLIRKKAKNKLKNDFFIAA